VTGREEKRVPDHERGQLPEDEEGWAGGRNITRRAMLRRSVGGAAAFAGSSWLLAACGGSSSTSSKAAKNASGSSTANSADLPIATKHRRQTLPMYSDNKAIASGKSPEKGPLIIYDWAFYLSPAVVKSFEQKYGVSAQVTTFASIDEAVNKVASGAITPDVWVPDPAHIFPLVERKLIQPINYSYVPNIDNVIPAAASPFYDNGPRYTTPNFINTFGIGWRNDLVKIDPASMSNPWNVFWDVPKGTTMGMVNAAPYDAICMSLIRNGNDLESVSQAQIAEAAHEVSLLKPVKWQYTSFQPIGTGVEKLAFAFDGDYAVIGSYMQKGVPVTAVSYYFPAAGNGLLLNDEWVIPKSAKNPVLGHLFLNHFLEMQSAIYNFRDIGYQTMLKDLTIDVLKAHKVADPHEIEMAFSPPAFQNNGIPGPVWNAQQLVAFEQQYAQISA
jgi:spermidine/putrescine transport system substrate-binding protein